MKVVSSARVQLVALLILNISFGYYATAAAEKQQELQEAEVNGAQKSSHKIRFGTKIAKIKSLPVEQAAAAAPTRLTASQRSAANNLQTASNVSSLNVPRISRRFDYHQVAPPSAQLIAQQEIPKANNRGFVATANSSHKVQQQQRSRGNTRHKAESLRSGATPQLSEVHSAQAQTQIQARNPTRYRVNNVEHSNVSSRNIGAAQTNRLTQSKESRAPLSADVARAKKSTTTTTTQQSLFSRNFQQNNPFNFFPQNFWSLSGPPPTTRAPTMTTTTTTSPKKPPKKYKHHVVTPTPFDDKFNFQKLPSIKSTEKPNLPRRHNNDGPFRIALPTVNFKNPLNAATKRDTERDKEKRNTDQLLRERFVCPRESEVRFQLFPKICKTDNDCSIWNRDELCCEIFGSKSCVSGMLKPLEESTHMPILGLIPRKCPTRPLAELWWDVKECATDNDCWPRVCCPDGRRRYCRTSEPELEDIPVPVKRSFNYLTEYLECTPPPPPIFDLHPKACTSTFDCFPNVCCQEAGLRHCRPPKKSLLTLMANFLNVDFVKRLTQNIVIK